MSSATQTPKEGNSQKYNTVVQPSPSENTEAPAAPNEDQQQEAGSSQDDNPEWEDNNMKMAPYDETQDDVGYEVNDFTVAP